MPDMTRLILTIEKGIGILEDISKKMDNLSVPGDKSISFYRIGALKRIDKAVEIIHTLIKIVDYSIVAPATSSGITPEDLSKELTRIKNILTNQQ